MIGNRIVNGAAALALGIFVCGASAQQGGAEMSNWSAKDKPGDGVVEVVLPDGDDPKACRLSVSAKGGASCPKVLCKGEQAVMTSSAQSKMAAKKIALASAKAHYVHFLQEEVNSRRVTDTIDAAIKNEGGANAGTTASSGYVTSATIREQASGMIKGFAVVEDGFYKDGDALIAYVIGGASCRTQVAADSLSAGNRSDTSHSQAQRAGGASDASTAPSRRRAGADQM